MGTNNCAACRTEAEPGWIEMDNNGPIVPCWLCRREEWLGPLCTAYEPLDGGEIIRDARQGDLEEWLRDG